MRVLIVDDEPLACERLRTLLAGEPDIEIVGECHDGRSAVTAIRKCRPDLIFLDVQMPEMDGFAVLEQLETMPAVVFVTAFDEFAVRAFEVHALDYLLKPFDRERFLTALARARRGNLDANLRSLLHEIKTRNRYLDRLVLRSGGRVVFLRSVEIDWIEGAGNYVRLHVGRDEYLHRSTLANLEASLDPDKFARIHRSTIVNVERVKELHPLFHGDYTVILRDGRRLTLSKAYRGRLQV